MNIKKAAALYQKVEDLQNEEYYQIYDYKTSLDKYYSRRDKKSDQRGDISGPRKEGLLYTKDA